MYFLTVASRTYFEGVRIPPSRLLPKKHNGKDCHVTTLRFVPRNDGSGAGVIAFILSLRASGIYERGNLGS